MVRSATWWTKKMREKLEAALNCELGVVTETALAPLIGEIMRTVRLDEAKGCLRDARESKTVEAARYCMAVRAHAARAK